MFKLRKLLSMVLAVGMILVTGVTAFASEIDSTITVDSYQTYLEEVGDKETIAQFDSLSQDDKSKLVQYLNSKEVMTQVVNGLANSNMEISLMSGDIQITSDMIIENETDSETMGISSVDYRKATYIKTVKIFGLSILESTAWIKYSHDGDSILEIQGENFVISRNFNPLLDSSWSGETSWKTSTTAYATADLTFSFIYDGLGMVIDTGEAMVSENIYNQTSGYVQGY